MKKFTLSGQEKLKSRKDIEAVFQGGKNFSIPPFRVFYTLEKADEGYLRFGVGVSSRNFKNAVDRNRVKRQTREAWRLGKAALSETVIEKGLKLNVFVVFTGRDLPAFALVSGKIELAAERLKGIIHETVAKTH